MQRYRDGKIPIDKFELTNCLRDSSSEFSDRMEKWIDIVIRNGVKDILYGSPYHSISLYRFPIIKVLAAKHLRELVLNNCSIDTSLSGGAANCHSLRKLSLSNVCLSENMLQDLLNSFPLIVSLILESVLGLDKIEAPTLEHSYFSNYSYLDLDVVECQNLKYLELNEVETSHGFLNLISKSQSLEVLKIQNCSDINDIDTSNLEVLKIQNCSGIRDIDTSNMKVLKIQNYSDIKDIDTSKLEVLKIVNCSGIRDIDSSNLVSLEYIGDQIPQLKRTSESSQLKHSKIILQHNNNIDVAWFRKLRNFLSKLTSSSHVSIGLYEFDDINIKRMKLRQKAATPKVDILNIEFLREECPKFMDALLWSCHPRRLNLLSTPEMIKCFIDCLMTRRRKSRLFNDEMFHRLFND